MNQDDAILRELNRMASRVVLPVRRKDPWKKKHVPLSFIEKPDNKQHKPIFGQLELFDRSESVGGKN